MNWNIAQAKQHFSDVVKQAATEPQIIYNRNTPVGGVDYNGRTGGIPLFEGRQYASKEILA